MINRTQPSYSSLRHLAEDKCASLQRNNPQLKTSPLLDTLFWILTKSHSGKKHTSILTCTLVQTGTLHYKGGHYHRSQILINYYVTNEFLFKPTTEKSNTCISSAINIPRKDHLSNYLKDNLPFFDWSMSKAWTGKLPLWRIYTFSSGWELFEG